MNFLQTKMRLIELTCVKLKVRKLWVVLSRNLKLPTSDTFFMKKVNQMKSSTSAVHSAVMVFLSWFPSLGLKKATKLSSADARKPILNQSSYGLRTEFILSKLCINF